MGHFAGLLALGHHHGVETAQEGEPGDLKVAEDLMRTCYEMYRRTQTGLAPEIAFFKSREATHGHPQVDETAGSGDFVIKRNVSDRHYVWTAFKVESVEDTGNQLLCFMILVDRYSTCKTGMKQLQGQNHSHNDPYNCKWVNLQEYAILSDILGGKSVV